MSDLALCVACADGEPQPIICRRCEDRIRRDLDQIGAMRKQLHEWREIDPGTPCRDDRHLLALVDAPVLTTSGQPDLTVIAATDPRTRRIVAGWHDSECGDATCTTPQCVDPAHRQDPADDVVNVDAEILSEARWIIEERHLSTSMADIFDALRVLTVSRDWTMRHPRVDEHAAILAGCVAALRGVLHDHADRIIGTCPAAHPEREACGGPLRLAWLGPLPLVTEDQVKPTHVVCDWCKDPWVLEAATLVAMLRVVRPRSFPVRVNFAAEQTGIPARTIRHWAATGRVRRFGHGEVDLVDVLAVCDTQAGA